MNDSFASCLEFIEFLSSKLGTPANSFKVPINLKLLLKTPSNSPYLSISNLFLYFSV